MGDCSADPVLQWSKFHQDWLTTEPVCCMWNGLLIYIPEGFRTDLATIPWPVIAIPGAAQFGNHNRAAIVHDYIYRSNGQLEEGIKMTRKEADRLFYDIMIEDQVPYWKATVMYWAVRLAPNLWNKF
jgi:hypothetical protein